jgi:hypothetical protein
MAAQAKWEDVISSADYRNACRSHDLVSLLSWAIKRFRGDRAIADGLDRSLLAFVPNVAEEILVYIEHASPSETQGQPG